MTIALFGTSADPPTEGHRVLLEGLLRHYPRVVTWASDNPMKQHGQPLAVRMELLAALVAAIGDPRLSLEPQLSSPWAIETLGRAAARWPGEPLIFVVGSDLLAQIPRWRQAAAVLAGCRLAVAARAGWPVQAADLARLEGLGARLELLDLQVPGTASSRVRGSGPAGSSALEEVPPALRPVLLEQNLYGLAGDRLAQAPPTMAAAAHTPDPATASAPVSAPGSPPAAVPLPAAGAQISRAAAAAGPSAHPQPPATP